MKTAVAYGRYSTDMQREESIDAQFRAIRDYCERNDITLLKTYADEGISGTTDDRPQFQKMIFDAESGVFDYIIVHKLDRFSRSKYDSAIYKRKLKLCNVQLISVLENLDGSPESLILESVLEGMNEYYSRNLSREVKKGKKENALKAKFNGGTPPLGYNIDKDNNYVINAYEAEIIKIIFDMYSKNHTYKEIMDYLNENGYKTKNGKNFTRNSFYEILNNEKYIGTYVYSKEDYDGFTKKRNYHKHKNREDMIIVENGVPAIIKKEVWNMSQERLKNNKHRQKRNKNGRYYILTGLIFCAECGAPMCGNTIRKNSEQVYHYYKCNDRVRTRKCKSLSARAEKIEKQVLDCFDDLIFTEFNKEKIIKSMIVFLEKSEKENNIIDKLKSELKETQNQIDNILDAIINGISSTSVNQKLKELENKKESLTLSMLKYQKENNVIKTLENKIRDFLYEYDSIYSFTQQEQTIVLKTFIDRIEFKRGKVNIKLKMLESVDIDGAERGI
ncbi:recombinase family protein [Peptoniphilus olsenii]|uniref:recombinase family protein n=1 Tax=Peptoniphilus olsenii TaxID=411570 RepID=UPI0033918515